MEQKDYDLSDQMTNYLANFCTTGNPNGAGLPLWNPTDGNSETRVLRLGQTQSQMCKPSMLKMVWTMLTNKNVGE